MNNQYKDPSRCCSGSWWCSLSLPHHQPLVLHHVRLKRSGSSALPVLLVRWGLPVQLGLWDQPAQPEQLGLPVQWDLPGHLGLPGPMGPAGAAGSTWAYWSNGTCRRNWCYWRNGTCWSCRSYWACWCATGSNLVLQGLLALLPPDLPFDRYSFQQ